MNISRLSLALCAFVFLAQARHVHAGPREDFDRLVQEAQAAPADDKLRERIIAAALALKPVPAVPAEARRHFVRAQAAVEMAKAEQEFAEAASEFEKGLRIAPWHADAYYNLGLVQEKAGQFLAASRNLKLYLQAAPNAAERQSVQDRIIALEYKHERRTQADADQTRLRGLSGTWTRDANTRYRVAVNDRNIEITPQEMYFQGVWRPFSGQRWQGKIDGNRFKGQYQRDWTTYRNGTMMTRSMSGTVAADGRSIRIEFVDVVPNGADGNVAHGWLDLPNQALQLTR